MENHDSYGKVDPYIQIVISHDGYLINHVISVYIVCLDWSLNTCT